MWDTCSGSAVWYSDKSADEAVETIVAASETGDVAFDMSVDGSVCIAHVDVQCDGYRAVTTYEACSIGDEIGGAAIKALLSNRLSTASLQTSLMATASPTVAARSEQVVDILSSR